MFSLEEISSVTRSPPSFRIFKPWWDTFMDYLAMTMLMIAVFGGTMQIYKDRTICLPIKANSTHSAPSPIDANISWADKHVDFNITDLHHTIINQKSIKISRVNAIFAVEHTKTNLDYQQYRYVNQACYFHAVPWFSKHFSSFILIHTVALMICSNFWFKYPKTSSKIEHLVFILEKCFDSPWTTELLSLAVTENSSEMNIRAQEKRKSTAAGQGISESAKSSTRTHSVIKKQFQLLDKKDGEQAKSLFEKVRKFRFHVEQEDTIYKLYVGQMVFKSLQCLAILCYFMVFIKDVNFDIICRPGMENVIGYEIFICTFSIALLLQRLILLYLILVTIYVGLCLRTLIWILRSPLKQYSFEKRETQFSDIPNVKNDFAFLLHLIDQYDPLYCTRFCIFLSEASEKKLKMLNLNNDWTVDKVRQQLIQNNKEQLELQLFMLTGIPQAVYDVTELQALRMELCTDIKISSKVTHLVHLEELSIVNCKVIVKPTALFFLGNKLHSLLVTFSVHEEVPEWINKLTRLRELSLIGSINLETKTLELEFLKELRYLKILRINSNLTKIPFNVLYVAPHLIGLSIFNNKNKLEVLHNLGGMFNLARLDLQNCQLDNIPHGIFSLTNLQELNLQGNELRQVDELGAFRQLPRLSSLNLSNNKITSLPDSFLFIGNLEQFNASDNQIETLPNSLFAIQKLHHLYLSNNRLMAIPTSIKNLKYLTFLDLSSNKLETLPDELFQCRRLKTLKLNNNLLTSLSGKIQQCSLLSKLELKGNPLEELPVEIGQCSKLKHSGLIIDEFLSETLPMPVKANLMSNQEAPLDVRLIIPNKASYPKLDNLV
ncbi:volume-regulated anion channel subunit LRRC8D-like [Mobula birostris]|uniref:volume-regulated anion channel subunit LRRC8D-like n=1 Tax=Mobula birostris TaxID=1983395 RepID=UPI003B27DE33